MPARRRPLVRRWNALPALTRNAPPRVLLVVGAVVVLLGALIVSRPLTSIGLLGVYVGASAVVMGAFELFCRSTPNARSAAGAAAPGADDEVIPPKLQREYIDKLCAEGQPVRWAGHAGYDHLRPILPKSRFLPLLFDWTKNLIERTPQVVDGCGLR